MKRALKKMRKSMQDKNQECVMCALFWDSWMLVLQLNTRLSPRWRRLLQVFSETCDNMDVDIFQADVKHVNICEVQMRPNPGPGLPLAMEPMRALNKGRLWRWWGGLSPSLAPGVELVSATGI